MSDPHDIRDELGLDAPEDVALAERLLAARPLPGPAFRGRLRRLLEARSRPVDRPARVRALIAGCAAAGALLLLVGAVSAAGAGPLGG
ncbi:MAG TPA: hypothetical protein VFF79_06540 [Conexibacter sp.]|nr:hypothetical protein [Conexibacter sp.]